MSTPAPLVPAEIAKICRYTNGKRTCIEIQKPVIFSQKGCVYCSEAKGKLQSLGIPFKDVDVSSNPKNFGAMMQVSGQKGTPVIVWHGKVMVGYDEKGLERMAKMVMKPNGARKRKKK